MNNDIEKNFKYLEEKVNKTIDLIDSLRAENERLKNLLNDMKARNNQSIEKINLILDNISKML